MKTQRNKKMHNIKDVSELCVKNLKEGKGVSK